MSSLFKSKKKKDKDKESSRGSTVSAREDEKTEEPEATTVERPSTAPTTTAAPKYDSNYAAEPTPAEPSPAEPSPAEPPPAVDAPAPAPVTEPTPTPVSDEPVVAREPEAPQAAEPASSSPVPMPPPVLAEVPAGPADKGQQEQGQGDGIQTPESPMEPGWEAVEADDGRVYYWNESTDNTTWVKPSSTNPSPRASFGEAAAAPLSPHAAAPLRHGAEGEVTSYPSLAERQRAFESGAAYDSTPPPTQPGSRRGSANQEKMKALQKAGIQDDPNKPQPSSSSQHKLAMAALERKKERIETAGTAGKGTTQMSDALKGLAAVQERPVGPSQHQQAMERLNRTSEVVSLPKHKPKPELVNPSEEAMGTQMHQAKAALFQKKQDEERRVSGAFSMKEEAMRMLNGKGVVSTKEAFQTKSKGGSQHQAAMAAFTQMEGTDMTTGGPKKSQLRTQRAAPPPGKPMPKTHAGSQRAAAMAAFQEAGKDV